MINWPDFKFPPINLWNFPKQQRDYVMTETNTLRKQQVEFTRNVARLIEHAFEMGYEVTLGDAYRDPRLHGEVGVKKGYGSKLSFHKKRLAIDLNLFKNGEFLPDTEGHTPLGEWWESIGGTWGGRFRDGNHYSWGEK